MSLAPFLASSLQVKLQMQPMIQHYTAERIPNPNPEGPHPWQVHCTVWNAVVGVCRRHGSVGPFHECPITDDAEVYDLTNWPLGSPADACDYWVIDDWYNDDRYVYLEVVKPTAFTAAWLCDLMHALVAYPGWGVGMSFLEGYILAFVNKIMLNGSVFKSCQDLESIIEAGRLALLKDRSMMGGDEVDPFAAPQ